MADYIAIARAEEERQAAEKKKREDAARARHEATAEDRQGQESAAGEVKGGAWGGVILMYECFCSII